MNIRLDIAIRDVAGKSGRSIIEAILAGNRDPNSLASLIDIRVKKSSQEIADSLHGWWREELLFARPPDTITPFQVLIGEAVNQLAAFVQAGPPVLLYKSTSASESPVFTWAERVKGLRKHTFSEMSRKTNFMRVQLRFWGLI